MQSSEFQAQYKNLAAAKKAYLAEKDRQKQCAIYYLDRRNNKKKYIWQIYDRQAFGRARVKELNEAVQGGAATFKVSNKPYYYYSLTSKDTADDYRITVDLSKFECFSPDMDDIEHKWPKKWQDYTKYIDKKSLRALYNIIAYQIPTNPCTRCASYIHGSFVGGTCNPDTDETACDKYDRYYNYRQGWSFKAQPKVL